MFQSRTHTCGELRLSDAGKTVTLAGWMENVREVGSNFAFVVLRDFYGTTQVVIESEEMMAVVKPLNKESTISVTGIVRERESKNKKIPTGEIEVVPTEIKVLGRCRYNELPFEINRSREADETQRLKYRYLDLRNPAVKQNIILRCNVVAALRQAMTEHGFMEITTPILTASSPEGARDYLVPARKHPGKFYALPQAPQQFKQLLMTAGFDRYFQIAPCFRDEDARGVDIELKEGCSQFRIVGLGHDFPVTLPVSGLHNVHNAVGAIAIALLYDVPEKDIQEAMATYVNTSQRQQTFQWNGYTIIDDTYNAGPESTEAALRVLGDTSGMGEHYKRIAVLGDMLELGNHASAEHHRIGRVAVYKADLLLTFGALSEKTVLGAITGGLSQRNAMNFESQQELLNVLRSRAKPGDVLLFKGSHGMHMENILKAFMEEEK